MITLSCSPTYLTAWTTRTFLHIAIFLFSFLIVYISRLLIIDQFTWRAQHLRLRMQRESLVPLFSFSLSFLCWLFFFFFCFFFKCFFLPFFFSVSSFFFFSLSFLCWLFFFFFAIYSKASSFPVSLLRLHISISRHLQFFYSSQEHVVGSQSLQTPLLYDNERL